MAYGSVEDLNVTLPPDDVQLTWLPLTPAAPPSSYEVSKSTDMGRTFTLLDTLTHDLLDTVVFDQLRQVFFYTDATGASGDVYRVVANYGATQNRPAFAVVSVFPPVCTVFGYVFAVDGSALAEDDREVSLTYVGTPYLEVADTAGVQAAVANVVKGVTRSSVNTQGVWQLRGLQGAVVDVRTVTGTRRVRLPMAEGPYNLADLPALPVAAPADRQR